MPVTIRLSMSGFTVPSSLWFGIVLISPITSVSITV
jgi:hypothetical protein